MTLGSLILLTVGFSIRYHNNILLFNTIEVAHPSSGRLSSSIIFDRLCIPMLN